MTTILKGIDISTYQKPAGIDYKVLAKSIDFAILRVGYTGWGSAKSKQKDSEFEAHYAKLSAVGVPIGVYWYSCASTPAEAREEARLTLEYIKDKKIEWPIYFDTEDNHHQRPLSKQALTEVALAYIKAIEKAGYFAGVYASTSWLNTELDMSQIDASVWVAHYGVKAPSYKGAYDVWQYTSGGMLSGYGGRLDLNYAYRDLGKVISDAGLNHLKESAPTPVPEAKPETKPITKPSKQRFAIGDSVYVNGILYGASDGQNPGVIVKNRLTKVTRYAEGAKKPYNTTGDLGWVAEGQLSAVKTATTSNQINLVSEPLYATSSASTVSSKVSGLYFYWDNKTVNGRRRITNRKDRIGVDGQVTGWIRAR